MAFDEFIANRALQLAEQRVVSLRDDVARVTAERDEAREDADDLKRQLERFALDFEALTARADAAEKELRVVYGLIRAALNSPLAHALAPRGPELRDEHDHGAEEGTPEEAPAEGSKFQGPKVG